MKFRTIFCAVFFLLLLTCKPVLSQVVDPVTLPYCQSFENTLGQWQQDTIDNFDWMVSNQATPTNNSGPDASFDGTYFIYTEASNPNQPGNTGSILLYMDITGVYYPELFFNYHMYGNQMGSLHLDVFDTIWHEDVWNLSGDQGNSWQNQIVNLSAFGGFGIVVLRFRGVIGSGSHSDMALDNICISNVFDNDIMIDYIAQPPATICHNPEQGIAVVVKNNGNASQTDIPVTVIITGPGSTNLTLSDTLAGPLQFGETQPITFSIIDMSVPGIYSITAFTSLSGDEDDSNDSIFYDVQVNPDISAFPFSTGFESGNNNFNLLGSTYSSIGLYDDNGNMALHCTGGSVNQDWTGSGTTTTATNAWINNTSHHASAITCNVDATTIPALTLSFDLKQVSPSANYFTYNWFRVVVNDTIQVPDIEGVSDFNPDGSNDYANKKFNLSQFAGTVFRLSFQSAVKYNSSYDPGAHAGGDNVFIDNINLYVPPLIELEVISLNDLPETSCSFDSPQEIKITLYNNGLSTFNTGTQIAVAYSFNGGTANNELITLTSDFSNGEYIDYTFTQTADFSSDGTYHIKAWISLTGDGDQTNDTTFFSILNMAEVSLYPYIQDFENGSSGWYSEMVTGANTWEAGTPSQSYISSAHSGSFAWMTGLDNDYILNEHSVLNSPCFDLTGILNPGVSFWMYFRTENTWDGGILEVSADEGASWEKAGGMQPGFYNSNTNNSSPQYISTPWWSGTNNGWTKYSVVLSDYAGQENIRLRFRLTSDYLYTDEGFAIDDFSMTDIMVCNAGNDQQICIGNPAQLSVSVSGGIAPYTYLWQSGESLNDSTIIDPVANPSLSTMYFVTVYDSTGSEYTDSVFVEVLVTEPVDLGYDFNICDGDQVPLGAPAGLSYFWSNGETTQTIFISESGAYSVTVEQDNGCMGISNQVLVGVNPVPVVDLGEDINADTGDTITLDAGNPGALFLWSTGETTQTIDVTFQGNYSVDVMLTNGCSASCHILVTFLNDVAQLSSRTVINIIPNPNNGKFILEIFNTGNELSVSISDQAGRCFINRNFNISPVKEEIDISNLPKSVYWLKIKDSKQVITKKLITM